MSKVSGRTDSTDVIFKVIVAVVHQWGNPMRRPPLRHNQHLSGAVIVQVSPLTQGNPANGLGLNGRCVGVGFTAVS